MKNIFTSFLILLTSFSMMANVALSDKEILVKLYEATHGAQWKLKWDLSQPMTSWAGVKVVNNQVVALDLQDNNLEGQIPNELGDLKNLQELNLHKNHLSGSIPASLGNLTALRVLDLSFNSLSETIPASICDLTNLKTLELYMNRLTGELPSAIGNLQNLETLAVFNNEI